MHLNAHKKSTPEWGCLYMSVVATAGDYPRSGEGFSHVFAVQAGDLHMYCIGANKRVFAENLRQRGKQTEIEGIENKPDSRIEL